MARYSLALLFAACAAGCGGGDESPAATPGAAPAPSTGSTPAPSPVSGGAGKSEGLWKEVVGAGSRYMLVEPDGQLWGIPLAREFSQDALFGDTYKGNITETGGTVSGTYGNVVLLGCVGYDSCTVTGLATGNLLSLNGVPKAAGFTLPGWSFNGKPEPSYLTAATTAQFAGTWSMSAFIPGNLQATGTLSITSTGAVTASNVSGCAFSGSLVPVTGKGYFKLALSSVSGTCADGVVPAQVVGVAFLTPVPTRAPVINVMWHGASVAKYFWSSGAK